MLKICLLGEIGAWECEAAHVELEPFLGIGPSALAQVQLKKRHGDTILACLALRVGSAVRNETVSYLIEGVKDGVVKGIDHPIRVNVNSLRHSIRNHSDAIVTADKGYSLARGSVWIDVEAFEALLATNDPESLRKAVSLYKGDLIRDWSGSWSVEIPANQSEPQTPTNKPVEDKVPSAVEIDFETLKTEITTRRSSLRHKYLNALETLARHAVQDDDLQAALDYLSKIPLDAKDRHEALRLRIRVHRLMGQFAHAAEVLQEYEKTLEKLKSEDRDMLLAHPDLMAALAVEPLPNDASLDNPLLPAEPGRQDSDVAPTAPPIASLRPHRKLSVLAAFTTLAIVGLSLFAIQQKNVAQSAESARRKITEAARLEAKRSAFEIYVGHMNEIQQEWRYHNVARIIQLLDEVKHNPHRDFEWGYWNRLCHLEKQELRGHSDEIRGVAYFSDDSRIVTGSVDGTAKIWDRLSGSVLVNLSGHAHKVNDVAVSPDNRLVATGSSDKTAKIWDVATGKCLRILTGHKERIQAIRFSPDGRLLLTGSHDTDAILWQVNTGKIVRRLVGHTKSVQSVAFSPDGKRIVTASDDWTARVWSTESGATLLRYSGQPNPLFCAVFSPDGRNVLSGSVDKTAALWDSASGRNLKILRGHTSYVMSVAFSPDGQLALTGGDDHTARLWDLSSGKELRLYGARVGPCRAVRFSNRGHEVAVADKTTLRIWSTNPNEEFVSLGAHGDSILSVALPATGNQAITTTGKEPAPSSRQDECYGRLWDLTTGKLLRVIRGHSAAVKGSAVSLDGKRVVTCSYDRTAKVWRLDTGELALPPLNHASGVICTAISPNGRWIATGCEDGYISLWSAASGERIRHFAGHNAAVMSVQFAPESNRLVSGGYDGRVRIWDAQNGSQLKEINPRTGPIFFAVRYPNRNWIVLGGYNNTASVYDADTGHLVFKLNAQTAIIGSAVVSSNGARIVTADNHRDVVLWDAESGRRLLTMEGHSAPIFGVAISVDGQTIISGGKDKALRLWKSVM